MKLWLKGEVFFVVILFLLTSIIVFGSSSEDFKPAKITNINFTPSSLELELERAPGYIISGNKEEIRRIVKQYGGLLKKEYRVIEALHVDNLPEEGIRSLKARGFRVEPNRYYRLHDINADIQIGADLVWALGINGSGVKVAIIDTGVQEDHVDLYPHIVACYNNGCVDKDGHGTHVAGIITAHGNATSYSYDARGVAPGALIYSAKACIPAGCPTDQILDAIDWAIEQDVDVISMSIGGGNYGSTCDWTTLAQAVNNAVYNYDIPFVISSGNEGSGVSNPACASGAIAVGAVNSSDVRPWWSNYGSELDIMAPGVDIFSTYSCNAPGLPGGCKYVWYATMSGTSMSAPHVAGTIALMKQKNPALTVNETKSILYSTAVDLGDPGWDQYYGWGRVNASESVNQTPSAKYISITLFGYPVDFGNFDPGTDDNPAPGNDLNQYIIRVDPETNVNVDVYQKGDDYVYNSYTLGIGNMTWSLSNDVLTEIPMTKDYDSVKSNVPPNTDTNMYYWIDIPSGHRAGDYNTTLYVKAVEFGSSV